MTIDVIGADDRTLMRVRAFGPGTSRITSERRLVALLAWLYAFNVRWLRAHPEAPRLYAAGVRYQREPRSTERWQTLPALLKSRRADCEDLGSALAAERTVRDDIPAEPALHRKQLDGFYLYHVDTKHADGTREDPSRVLGMGKA